MLEEYKKGMTNETMIRVTLNNHCFKDLSDKWKSHVKRMFPKIKDDDKIIAMKHPNFTVKPDLILYATNKRVTLSIKSGHNPQVHQEPTYTFYPFLESLDVPKRIIKIMKFYHYGTSYMLKENGDKIYTREEILEKFPDLISEANDFFAAHEEIVREIAFRAIIQGRGKNDIVDYFYYGGAAKGFLLSVSEILKLATDYPFKLTKTIAFKQLTYSAGSRHMGDERQKMIRICFPVLCKLYYDQGFMLRYG